ncbi:hypothetical protein Prudu_019780, partial [Prunus dulcis]
FSTPLITSGLNLFTSRGGCNKGQEGSIDPLACRRLLWRSQENSCRPLGQQLVDPLDALNVLDEMTPWLENPGSATVHIHNLTQPSRFAFHYFPTSLIILI